MMQMGGRTMDGWITVAAWVKRGVAFAKTLPPK
jgi:hypothetical protein